MDVNIATDMKGVNVSVTPTTVEREDAVKPSVQPVPASSEGVSVKLNNRAQRGTLSKEGSGGEDKLDQQDKLSQQGKLSLKELEAAAEEIRQRFQAMGSDFDFGLHRDSESESIVAQLRDKKTDEIIKQFPSDEVLKLREKLKDLIGLIFDEKV